MQQLTALQFKAGVGLSAVMHNAAQNEGVQPSHAAVPARQRGETTYSGG